MTDTPAVTLRLANADDRDRLLDWRNQPDVARWMYSDHVITPDEHQRWLTAALNDSSRRYWIIQLDGEPVGLANLVDISAVNRKASWAYYLASPAVRGRGVGSYVEFFVIEHVFTELGLAKLCCEVLVENETVCQIHESFGFQREALLRQHVWKAGQPLDVVGLGLLAQDWARIRPQIVERLRLRGYAVQ